ncbi:MAG: 3-deoxy-8-phosphooctulonate synthase [Lentisphaeria bacterium]|nr:3-deoxy-8-phosphooctulonate synthase [Lentisphaeria bacterium]
MVNVVKFDNISIGDGKFVLLGGPCMAETLETCLKSAEFLKKLCQELDIQYVFKASYDKANRSSFGTKRGPGLEAGLKMLAAVKEKLDLPIVTDIHNVEDAAKAAEVADILQIPAFLCRQTDLLVAAGETNRVVNIKKGQFMAPEDMKGAVEKVYSTGNKKVLLTERGSSFGYHNLVVDMRSLQVMRNLGVPVIFDATHSVQLPGGNGTSSGGAPEFIPALARAAAAVGIDGLFAEIHPNPAEAWSDGANSLNFQKAEKVLREVKAIYEFVSKSKEN